MEWPPSGAGWRKTNRMGEKCSCCFDAFSVSAFVSKQKNLLWLNCRSRFFYRLRLSTWIACLFYSYWIWMARRIANKYRTFLWSRFHEIYLSFLFDCTILRIENSGDRSWQSITISFEKNSSILDWVKPIRCAVQNQHNVLARLMNRFLWTAWKRSAKY